MLQSEAEGVFSLGKLSEHALYALPPSLSSDENGFSASGHQTTSSLPDYDESSHRSDMQPTDSLEPTHYEDPLLLRMLRQMPLRK